jgi:PAS domain S-box-containing protein
MTNDELFSGLGPAILMTESDAIVVADRRGLITFWNPGAVRIFGFSKDDAVGKSLDIIIPENLRDRHWQGYENVMATGESHYDRGDVLTVPAICSDGCRISVEFTIVILRDESQHVVGMAAIMRDITKRFEEMRALRRQLADATKARG